MSRRQQTKGASTAQRPAWRVDEYELHDRTYRVGDVIEIANTVGQFKIRHFDLRSTAEVEVFGGPPGRAMIRNFTVDRILPPDGSNEAVEHKAKALSADPIRDAIASEGRVEVPIGDPSDQVERKRLVNKVFSRAYTLGLKGKFKVRVEDGVVIGERTE